MQLDSSTQSSSIRQKLSRTALALALLEVPAIAHADSGPTTQFDITTLFYGEQSRTDIFEPMVRVSRLFPDGQSLYAQFGLDVVTGASPSGALPSGEIQTTTGSSGRILTIPAGAIPMMNFQDQRFGFDGDWHKSLSRFFTSDIGGHFSRERDYQSLGINGKMSVDLFRRLTTLTFGGGYNHDSVFPTGGTPAGLSDGTIISNQGNPKQVKNFMIGISQVLSRKWLFGFDFSRTFENGYLTEPYKVISIVDPVTGIPVSQLTDKRPDARDRTSLLFSSAYHLSRDVVYLYYRHYWDTWKLQSDTFDFKYRHELGSENGTYLEPHIRYYHQTPAEFFTVGLVEGDPLPEFATADTRLGLLKTMTLGTTLGFHIFDNPSLWTIRAEYIRQIGDSYPVNAVGIQQTFDLSPPLNTFAVVVGYSFNF